MSSQHFKVIAGKASAPSACSASEAGRSDEPSQPLLSNLPYTHADHARACHAAAQQGVVLSGKLVQVRKKAITYCARIINAWTTPDGLDCWTVEAFSPEMARFTVSCRNVRSCGDSACSCGVDAGTVSAVTCAAKADFGLKELTCL